MGTVIVFLFAFILAHTLVAHNSQFEHFELVYESTKYNLINVTENLNNLCPEAIRAEDENKNTFITPEFRYDICKASYASKGESFEHDFSKCYEDEGHVRTKWNPCYLACITIHNHSCNDNGLNKFLLTEVPCGENHFCDSNGCCIERPPHDDQTDPNSSHNPSQEPISPHDDQTDPNSSHNPSQEPISPHDDQTDPNSSHNPSQEPISPHDDQTDPNSSEKELKSKSSDGNSVGIPNHMPRANYTCLSSGYFADKTNPRVFYHCKYFATLHACAPDERFNATTHECLYDLSTEDPALEFIKWKNAIHCTASGTFISPYNCKYFYTCVPDHDMFHIYFNSCLGDLIFNEGTEQCDYKHHRCNNVLTVPEGESAIPE